MNMMVTSPFQRISEAFQPRYRVNFSIQNPNGSILLTLSNDDGVRIKRFIMAEQWQNPQKLERLIQSLSCSLAIEHEETGPAHGDISLC